MSSTGVFLKVIIFGALSLFSMCMLHETTKYWEGKKDSELSNLMATNSVMWFIVMLRCFYSLCKVLICWGAM